MVTLVPGGDPVEIDYNGGLNGAPPPEAPPPSERKKNKPRTFVELLLDRIAAMEPGNFHPRSFLLISSEGEEQVLKSLDQLHKKGLIDRVRDEGLPGELVVRLSAKGRALYADEKYLERWREEQALTLNTTRKMLGLDSQPWAMWATRLLFIVILANFIWGGVLSWQAGQLGNYLHDPDAKGMAEIYHQIGAAEALSLAQGEWWRLFTCMFVHFGVVHIVSNSIGLMAVGMLVSRMMGPGVVLLVFVIAGVWGSGFGMTFQPQAILAGASGAICGLMAAFVLWFVTHRHRLDPKIAGRFGSFLLMDLILITGISLLPGISGFGHLGGAIGGALVGAGLILLSEDWGVRANWRPLAGSACLMVAGAGAAALVSTACQSAAPLSEKYRQSEDAEILNKGVYPEFAGIRVDYRNAVTQFAEPLQLKDKFKRNREMAAQAVDALAVLIPRQQKVLANWKGVVLQSKGMRLLAQRAVELLDARDKYCQVLEDCLRQGREWPMEKDREVTMARKMCRQAKAAYLKQGKELGLASEDLLEMDDPFEEGG